VLPYSEQTERVPPHLRALEQLADAVVASGVKEITGEIVGDDSLFAFQRYGAGWGQDDLMWSDGAPASALTVNDNVIFLSLAPGEVGGPAKVTMDPDVSYYAIDNRVTTIPPRSGPREIAMNREPGSKRLTLWGSLPADDAGWSQAIAIDDPAEYAAAAFREMLVRRGVTVHGEQRAAHLFTAELPIYALDVKTASEHTEHGGGSTPAPEVAFPARAVLARLISRPLRDDITVINKVSQNLHAELALRLIGHERGSTASLESALAAEKAFLLSIGLEEGSFRFYDGSGMSFHDVATPRAVTTLLRWTQTQPWADVFRESLPVAGEDGSLDDRFRESVARARVWAKTGSLTDVHCLSGFAESESGRKYVFSVLVNHHGMTGSAAKKVIDHVIELLVDDQTGRPIERSAGGALAP
jgi:D-alanyl-D-alanine carboxypeptidase/D-alanyl-D-alanine-endopeptidase (penicillin-binding protein 4)